jgi:hypothetical protein
MVIPMESQSGVHRITVALDPVDVDLLDRLAGLEGLNRSAELRALLTQIRPVLRATVEAFESAGQARDRLDQAVATATVSELQAIEPEVEEMSRRFLGIMAKLEGAQAAGDAPASNTGATDS